MTTPPTTAGWYPDPDGSGGQRYWDGAGWTAQRPDAPETTEETAAWPTELPPWPEDMEMPSWEEAGKAEPADSAEEPAVEDAALEDAAGEDAAVEDAAVEEPVIEDAGTAESGADPDAEADPSEPDAAESAVADESAEAVSVESADFGPSAEQPTTVVPLLDQPTAAVPTFAPPADPAAFAAAEPGAASASPLKGYLAGVAGLLVVLVGVLVWAFAFADRSTDAIEATGTDETSETAGTTAAATDSADPTEASGDGATATGGQTLDGEVVITNNGIEITPTVSAVDNEFVTKTASGEFVVVRLTLLNNGQLPATFLADQQVLTAGGQTYNTETESTFYLGGISAVLNPGQPVEVAFAYDVPPGTEPESLLVHGDLASAGAVIELS